MNKSTPVWECYRLTGISKPDERREALERSLETSGCPCRYDIRKAKTYQVKQVRDVILRCQLGGQDED